MPLRARTPGYEYMSLDDFEELLADKPAHEKWELIGGRVVRMMVGARWEHARIVQNIARHLGNALDAAGSRCQVFAETFFVKQTEMEAATLPDVMVVCGDLAPGATSTDAPVVIFEVMSAGSEARDRLEKWHVYQKLPSLRHYVLVARDHPALEVFDRENGLWSGLRLLNGADDALSLDALGLSLSLSDIYRGVLDRA